MFVPENALVGRSCHLSDLHREYLGKVEVDTHKGDGYSSGEGVPG